MIYTPPIEQSDCSEVTSHGTIIISQHNCNGHVTLNHCLIDITGFIIYTIVLQLR